MARGADVLREDGHAWREGAVGSTAHVEKDLPLGDRPKVVLTSILARLEGASKNSRSP
jgi:hypothetical protein